MEKAHMTNQQSKTDCKSTPWLTPEEAALYLSISIGTLRNWTSARFIPFSKRGRIVRYNRETLDRWLEQVSCPGRCTLAVNLTRPP